MARKKKNNQFLRLHMFLWIMWTALGSEVHAQGEAQFWRTVDDHTIEVNLDATPKLPFFGAKVEWPKSPAKRGWVTVQYKKNYLYVDGRKVLLHLEKGQKTGTVDGHKLRSVLESKDVLHPNLLDALYDNPHLIPQSWKYDSPGRTQYIHFWAVGFRRAGSLLYFVRSVYWDGEWNLSDKWLGDKWDVQSPAAILAS